MPGTLKTKCACASEITSTMTISVVVISCVDVFSCTLSWQFRFVFIGYIYLAAYQL